MGRLRLGPFWTGPLPILFFLIEFAILLVGPGLHASIYEGEIGLVELMTFGMALACVPFAILIATRTRGRLRVLSALVAVGMLYFAGEEISWGQSWAKWDTPSTWQSLNKQKETNFHNLKGPMGITNTAPRALLNVGAAALVVAFIPQVRRRLSRSKLAQAIPKVLYPSVMLIPTASLVIVCDLINEPLKAITSEWGETLELFMAWMLLAYANVVWWRLRTSPDPAAAPHISL